MVLKKKARLTRAQSEGTRFQLPDNEQSNRFIAEVRSLENDPTCLLEVLHLAQNTYGHLSKPLLGWIAEELKLPRNQVYGTATFYTMFRLKPKAKYVISVCDNLSCYLQGGGTILQTVRDAVGIVDSAETSDDGLFSIRTVSCLGLCDRSPAIMINGQTYGNLTPHKLQDIIFNLQDKALDEGRPNDGE